MKKIEDMSYEEIINCSIPFACNIILDGKTMISMLDNKKDEKVFIDNLTKRTSKCVESYLGNIRFLVSGNYVISDNGEKNILRFSSEQIINNLFEYLNCNECKIKTLQALESNDFNEIIELLKSKFIEKRRILEKATCIEDIKQVSMMLYQEYANDYEYYSNPYYFEKEKQSDVQAFKKTAMWLKDFFKELNKPLDSQLLSPINKSKLMLYLSKQYFELAKGICNIVNSYSWALAPLKYVSNFLNEYDVQESLSINDMYYYSLISMEESSLAMNNSYEKNYSVQDLRNEFNEFLEKNPEIKKQLDELLKYNKEDFNNMTIEEIAEYTTLILEEAKENWQTVNKNQIQLEIDELIKTSKTVSPEEKGNILLLSKKISILLKNKPLRVIKGIDTFTGSYGFIYSNGKIVLETLYEDEAKRKISNGKASYVMDIEKFKEYAKLKRKELMGKEDVDRVVHRGDWEEKFIKLITSNQESTSNALSELEFIDANIDSIINVDELDKCLKKLDELEQTLPKQEIEKEVKKIKKKKKKLVLGKLEQELHDNPSSDYAMMQDKEDANVTEEELLKKIGADNFIDFMKKYYKLLDGNIELKEKRKKLKRNPAIAAYTKHRANCTCDLCGEKYAEESIFDAHHLIPLKDGGPDNIYNTVCLCPNCHRIAHTTGFRDNEMYLLMNKIKTYLEKEDLTEEYMHKFYETFKYYLQMYVEEDWFMEWNQHKR